MEAEVEPALEAVVVVVVVIMVGFPEDDPVELELDPDEGLTI